MDSKIVRYRVPVLRQEQTLVHAAAAAPSVAQRASC